MELITIEQARAHSKTDGVDDEVLTIAANAAERVCAQLANRALFPSAEAMDAAIAAVSDEMAAAFTSHANALDAAASLDEENKTIAVMRADAALQAARNKATNIIHGIIVDDDIIAAILLVTGHFYRNREEVVSGANAKVDSIPLGAERIMRWYRRVGEL